nr:hypothetical protein [Allomuricauda sp.]
MKKSLSFLIILFLIQSCIPLRVAPNIESYKVTKGKRFQRFLPKKQLFIFEDPKEADEFFYYVDTKFGLKDTYVDINVPFCINDNQYYFSFYETEIPDKTLNLVPVLIDGLLSRADIDPMLEEAHESRKGNYYVGIEVYNEDGEDCLHGDYESKKEIIEFLNSMRNEYLNTNNYNEVVFKN